MSLELFRVPPRMLGVALLLTSIACGSVQAEIYKWTDSKGGVHFSEQPPAGARFEKVNPNYSPAVAPAAVPPQGEAQPATKGAEPDRQAQERQRQEEAARIRMQNCETAQRRLADLQSSPRLRVTNPDGTVQRLSEDDRQARIAEAQDLVSKYCE